MIDLIAVNNLISKRNYAKINQHIDKKEVSQISLNYIIRWASKNKQIDTVKLILNQGYDNSDYIGLSLRNACFVGDFEMVKLLKETNKVLDIDMRCAKTAAEIKGYHHILEYLGGHLPYRTIIDTPTKFEFVRPEKICKCKVSWKCVICMDMICCHTNKIVLECKHFFHGECFERWDKTCPICRGESNIERFFPAVVVEPIMTLSRNKRKNERKK